MEAHVLNRIQIIGHLGQDVELKTVRGDKKVANFTVATTARWNTNSGPQAKTTWHRIIVWGSKAEHCAKYLRKGKLVFVSGSLNQREYTKAGQRTWATEIIAQDVIFLTPLKPNIEPADVAMPYDINEEEQDCLEENGLTPEINF